MRGIDGDRRQDREDVVEEMRARASRARLGISSSALDDVDAGVGQLAP